MAKVVYVVMCEGCGEVTVWGVYASFELAYQCMPKSDELCGYAIHPHALIGNE